MMINEISKTPIFLNKSKKDDNLREVTGSGEKPAESASTGRRDIVDISGPRPGAGEPGEKSPIPVNDRKSKVAPDDNRGQENKTADIPSKSAENHAEADKAIEAVKSDFVRPDTVASAYGQNESGIGKALNKVV
ncbi:MAG TPA: hypothetical protein ENH01_04560 [Nitrospirae bacterium]|nr:hypothetical protein [Nitrospirota bacterium]